MPRADLGAVDDGSEAHAVPTELNESDRIEWIPLAEVLDLIDRREIVSGATVSGLLRTLAGRS